MQSLRTFFKRSISFFRAHPKLDWAILGVGLAIFGLITVFNITNASIWFDEAFSSYIIQFNYFEIARYTATDVHPPLFYWILKSWSLLFGTTEVALRSMSILFGMTAIGASFVLARKFFGRIIASVSLLFLVISPMLIRYSDEARMYTLAATIVMLATLVMVKAMASKKKGWWILYGVLVALGMWTHYFTILAWLAHWVWRLLVVRRKGISFKETWRAFFSKQWVLAYLVALGVYLPWLPFMLFQFGVIQVAGFWIGPITADTPTNYLTNVFYYLEHGQVQSWWAVGLFAVVTALIIAIPRAYKALNAVEKRHYLLVAALAWVPIILLVVGSLPPLRPLFVERYFVPAAIILTVFLSVSLIVGTRRWRLWVRAVPVGLVCLMMIVGITNVYSYGNFNKNSNTHIFTGDVIKEIDAIGLAGEPIVANSPWIFYEAVFYNSEKHPVYFIDENTQYDYGSLDMLRDHDKHKILNLADFSENNPVIWYIGGTDEPDVAPYKDTWQRLQTVSVRDNITGKTVYKATQYRINAE